MAEEINITLDGFSSAILRELAVMSGKSETMFLVELIKNHVVFDLTEEEREKVMEKAKKGVR